MILKKKVIYTGAFRFPDKDAAAARVLSIGKILAKLEYEVVFAGWEPEGREVDRRKDNLYFYEGFEYHSMNELGDTQERSFLQKAKAYTTKGTKTMQWIEQRNDTGVFAIIVYNSNTFFLSRLRKYCKRKNINLIADVTEWYEADQLPMGRFGLPAFDNAWRMTRLNPKIKNLIVISGFLEKYYQKKGCRTVKIPPLIDFHQKKWQVTDKRRDQELTLVYAGSPGKKDFIDPLLEALLILRKNGRRVLLNIYGLTVEQTKKYSPATFEQIKDQIQCFGRILQKEVPGHLAQADYSVLLRADKRYAHAGFSTKLVESLSAGVPVIANDTSDIKQVLDDNKNGFLLDSPSAKSLADGLSTLLQEPESEHSRRRENAKQYARKEFDYNIYILQLQNFMDGLE